MTHRISKYPRPPWKSPRSWGHLRWTPQSLLPALKHDGTSILRPAKSASSASHCGSTRARYQLSPPWKPVRTNSPPRASAARAAAAHPGNRRRQAGDQPRDGAQDRRRPRHRRAVLARHAASPRSAQDGDRDGRQDQDGGAGRKNWDQIPENASHLRRSSMAVGDVADAMDNSVRRNYAMRSGIVHVICYLSRRRLCRASMPDERGGLATRRGRSQSLNVARQARDALSHEPFPVDPLLFRKGKSGASRTARAGATSEGARHTQAAMGFPAGSAHHRRPLSPR